MTSSSFREESIAAKDARYGDLVIDEYGQQYRVEKVENLGHGVYLYKAGQGYPEFYLNESRMTRTVFVPDPKPFKVYTRKYLANGDCIKGLREFKTRAAATRYVANAPADVAITWNN